MSELLLTPFANSLQLASDAVKQSHTLPGCWRKIEGLLNVYSCL